MIWITTSLAAPLLLGHALLTKALMTVRYRLKLTTGSTPKAEIDKTVSSQSYQRMAAAQLNEAEYAPILMGVCLYLASKGVAAPYASTLAVFGQVWYFWLRSFVGHAHEGGIDPPVYAPGTACRYIAMGMMAFKLYELA